MSSQLNRNFFSQIQGKFGALTAERGTPDFQGRYIAHILESVAHQQPSILIPFVRGFRGHHLSCSTEYEYARGRWADLAVFCGDESEPRTLVEIKAKDIHNKRHNVAQLQSYADWATTAANRCTIYLSQYPLPKYMRDEIELASCRSASVAEVPLGEYARLISPRGHTSELVRSLLEYLYFEGLALAPFDESDIRALHTFLGFSFLPHLSGHKKLTSVDRVADGPRIFGSVVQNWQLVSARRADRLRLHNKVSLRTPIVKYLSSPLYREGTDLSTQENSSYESKSGGTWLIYARSVLVPHAGRNLCHEYGLELAVARRTKKDAAGAPISANIYSSIFFAGKHYGLRRTKLHRDVAGAAHYVTLARCLSNESEISHKLDKVIQRSLDAAQKEITDPQLKKAVARASVKIVA